MPRRSRYIRPEGPPPIHVQARDIEILRAVYRHRYLYCHHIQQLLFRGRAIEIAQTRLRKLWTHRFLDRTFLPIALDGTRKAAGKATQPLYSIARHGADLLARELDVDVRDIPHTREANRRGFMTLEHNLAVTDFLVALEAAAAVDTRIGSVVTEREHELRHQASSARAIGEAPSATIIPDGVATVHERGEKAPNTFYLEIVRADVKGGNKHLLAKLRAYAALNHRGYFKKTYCHDRIRAVLIATTSLTRAENFRALADRGLAYGRQLFWFGSYETKSSGGTSSSAFTPATILGPLWMGIDRTPRSMLPAIEPTTDRDASFT